jgi:pimeloyl-ACP methyl ester carboxylesterase
VQGRFVVDDHRLWLRCVGGGSPAIIYVHPYDEAPTDPAGEDASGLQTRLRRSHRVCLYDRANVGRSGKVAGRQTGADAVRDLHAVLASARITGPYVLVGSRFGALIADMYAATYPNSVVGMVFVDGRLPQDEDVAERFFPRRQRIRPGEWADSAERLDQLATYDEASRLEGDEPKVPLTYIGAKDLAIPPALPVQRITAVMRDVQQTFVERFDPGRLVLLDNARPLERSAPDRIVQEVDKVVEAARAQARDRAKQQQDQSGQDQPDS